MVFSDLSLKIMNKLYLNELQSRLEMVYSVTLAMSCVYSYFQASAVVCSLYKCDNAITKTINAMFPRLLATICFISKIMILIKNITSIPKYKKKIKEYDHYFPINISKTNCHRRFTTTIIIAYIIITVPVNILRLYLIYNSLQSIYLVIIYAIMYIQNLSICMTEVYFIVRCFALNQRFQSINDEMAKFKSITITANKYPAVLQNDEFSGPGSIDGIFSKTDVYQFTSNIELLRTRHQFVRSIFSDLNDLYSIQIGMSLSFLFIFVILDIYGEYFGHNKKINSDLLICGLLIQYSFRFFAIVLTTHFTTKQAYKTKTLISDINNRYLDNSTKEELQLFFNQIFHSSVEFTTCDFFTINAHLVTSAIATGTAYLVVLLQYQ